MTSIFYMVHRLAFENDKFEKGIELYFTQTKLLTAGLKT